MQRFNNKLEKWIGLFSYQDDKGIYVDLKGKIKRNIQEELEKESTNRKAIDTTMADKLFNLTSEIEDIRTRIPR